MKVGILTTFSDLRPSYSLATVVTQQLITLNKYGYNPVLFALESFEDEIPKGTELRNIVPQLVLEPYSQNNLENLDKDVLKAKEAMLENFKDIDVLLTHDIIFINSYLPYNIALREVLAELKHLKCLHWMHSGPSLRPQLDGSPYDNLYTLPERSKLVYMNYTDVVRAAEMYGVFPKDVRTIFNPMDIRELYDFQPETRAIIEEYDLMRPDFIATYPLSTTRMGDHGKKLKDVIQIMAEIKSLGNSVALVVPNAHANADREKQAIEEMYQFAHVHGLERRELIFTSLHNTPQNEHGVRKDVVRDFFTLGNLFIFPTISENCPLTLLEAMAGKNILVLNGSFPALRDFGLENALYFRFGSLVDEPQWNPSKDHYLKDVAKLIISEFENNKAIKAQTRLRQEFNIDRIATKQLLPAIQEMLEL